MLLSGNDNHIAGMGGQGTVSEVFGFEGRLMDRIVPIPALLREKGYHTCMAGKWHLGSTPEANPHQKGFERSFVLLGGAGNHYTNRSVLTRGYSRYTEDGDSTSWEDGTYSTDFYTDKLIEYIDQNRGDGRPFFVYAAYTSPHWPLQVDRKYWEKYRGKYDEGYEKLRERRLNSLKSAGMIPPDATLPEMHASVIPWDALSDGDKSKEARKMELYAGMVDNLDHNLGRLIAYLRKTDLYENTLFVFMSDNGAAYRDFINVDDYQFLREHYNDDYDNMGNPDSYISYGPQWAEAGSAPFRYFKDYATEGGINTTLIISGPGVQRKNEIHHGFATLLDLAPTFYEYAGVSYPDTYEGHEVYPLRGSSLVPFLSGNAEEIHDDAYVFAIEHYGNAMLRKGDWKITNYITPFKVENFGLYNLSEDLGEQNDLKEQEPGKYAEMLAEWEKYASEVRLPD
jgi:arylsulfatase